MNRAFQTSANSLLLEGKTIKAIKPRNETKAGIHPDWNIVNPQNSEGDDHTSKVTINKREITLIRPVGISKPKDQMYVHIHMFRHRAGTMSV